MPCGCMGYQEVQTLSGWQKVYAPVGPQALEVPEGCGAPEPSGVQVGRSGIGILFQDGRHPREGERNS